MRKFVQRLVALVMLAMPAAAPVVYAQPYPIIDDHGGDLDEYIQRWTGIRVSGGTVRIDGLCLSACAMVTSVPADRVCVTPSAVLGFHSAWHGHGEFEPTGTAIMWNLYPAPVRALVNAAGWDGLTEHPEFVFVRYDALRGLYRDCAE